MVGMEESSIPGRRYTPAELDGKTLVIIQRADFGYTAVTSGAMRAVGDVVWLDAADRSFPISASELQFVEPVAWPNRIGACQGFNFFTVRR